MKKVSEITHPDYDAMYYLWEKFRLTFEGGDDFINKYLQTFSTRELAEDFYIRKMITYCPAHAKSAIIDIKNAIFQRMVDVIRLGGPKTYNECVLGEYGGVDRIGHDMNTFIGSLLLPELLVAKRVGIYVDKPEVGDNATKLDTNNLRPYLYHYHAEAIRSWAFDAQNNLQCVLLQDVNAITDEDSGLVTGYEDSYRLLKLIQGGVLVTFYDKDSKETGSKLLKLKKIPFVMIEISQSLLHDVANYQIALLNLGSSDMNYAVRSNFPFYTEQFAAIADISALGSGSGDGTEDKKITTGVAQGRRYPKGLERPAFIHPSPEPLKVSMEKQDQLERDIRKLVNLAVKNLDPRQSGVSQAKDSEGLEAGLSYIGAELQSAERLIAEIWSNYEGSSVSIKIQYPNNYSLKTDEDRRKEADELNKLAPTIPSKTYQKSVAKQIAMLTIGTRVAESDLQKIYGEIDSSEVLVTDPEIIKSDHEAGFVGTELASKLRGYPPGEVEKAAKDHAERAARILKAQTMGEGSNARGVPDVGNDPDSADEEKETSQNADKNPDAGGKMTKGPNK